MVTTIDNFKRIDIDLNVTGGITQEYSLSNDITLTNSCFMYFHLNSTIPDENVVFTIEEYSTLGGTLVNVQTFTMNSTNKILNKNVNVTTSYTLIKLNYNSFIGTLNGYFEKLIIGIIPDSNTLRVDISGQTVITDISGQTVIVSGGIDISGQRVITDISGQTVDISGQRVITDISGQRVITDISGQRVITDISGQTVDISGQRVITNISGQTVDISGQRVITDISGQTVDISGQRVITDISGQRVIVDISGQRVITNISGQTVDISGQRVITDISGQTVDISGQRVITDISGQTVDISGQRVITNISGQTVDISGQRVITNISGQTVDISGQRVIVDISGQRVIVDISGQRVITDISGQTVDISGQRVITNISGQTVDISGQRVITNISGQTVDISGQRVITDISGQRVITDISGQTVIVHGGIDISGQRVDISGQRVITNISGQTVDISGQRVITDISGQRVDISGQTIRVQGGIDISGQRVDISGQRVDISGQILRVNLYDSSNNGLSTTINLGVNYLNTYSKIAGTSNGTDNKVILTDSGGRVQTNSRTTDGSGNNIFSTNNALNVQIKNNVIDISGNINVINKLDISGNTYVDNKLEVDISGQTLNIKDLTFNNGKLNVDVSGVVNHDTLILVDGIPTFFSCIQTYDPANDMVSSVILNKIVELNDTIHNDVSGFVFSNNKLEVDISGQSVIVTSMPPISVTATADISGQRVDISGQTVITDISGQRVITDISGQRVITDISGQRVITDISGQTVIVQGGIDISGQRVDISGQTVIVQGGVDISGQRVDISGQRVITDISGQTVIVQGGIDISGQRVDISGQSVRITSMPSFSVTSDISGQRVDISGQRVDISGQRVDISGQRLIVSVSNTVPISGSVSITGEVNLTEDSRVLLGTNNIAGGVATLTSVNPAFVDAGVRALHTFNYNQAYNNNVGIYLPLTSKTVGGTYALNCYNIRDENDTKQYTFGGTDTNGTAYRIIGGNATASGLAVDLYNFGFPNARTYWASLSLGTPSTLMYIDYIDSNGDLVEDNVNGYTLVGTDTSTNWTLLTSMIGGPIKIRTSTTIGDTVNTARYLYISPVTNTNRAICHTSIGYYSIATFTIPNGYIGYINNLTADFSTAGILILVKWDVNGIRSAVYRIGITSTLNISVSSGYEGSIGGVFVAGETLAWTHSTVTTTKTVQASITLRKI
jgi:hypothetical protein